MSFLVSLNHLVYLPVPVLSVLSKARLRLTRHYTETKVALRGVEPAG
jgi:hypothetical protein